MAARKSLLLASLWHAAACGSDAPAPPAPSSASGASVSSAVTIATSQSATTAAPREEAPLRLEDRRATAERVLSAATELAREHDKSASLATVKVRRMKEDGRVDLQSDGAFLAVFEALEPAKVIEVWSRATGCSAAPCLRVRGGGAPFYLRYGKPLSPPACPLAAAWGAVVNSGVPRGVAPSASYGDGAGPPTVWRFEVEGSPTLNRSVDTADCRVLTDAEYWARPGLKTRPTEPPLRP